MNSYPAIKFIIAFILGVLFQYFFSIEASFALIILIIFLIISFVLLFLKIKYQSYLLTGAFLISLFLIGFLRTSISDNKAEYPFDAPKIKNVKILATISKIDLLKEKKISFEAYLMKIDSTKLKESVPNKFLCSIWKDTTLLIDSIYSRIQIGNSISFYGTIARAKNIRNPGEFDYEAYLTDKGISGIINCYKPESFEIIDDNVSFFSNTVFTIRKLIDQRIKQLYNKDAAALLKGILLADRSDIDYNIKNSFVNSGVIHVLAVSGLHVGFIITIFFLLFGRLDIRLKFVLTSFGIILFLIITGGHASVFRASTMAIVLLIAKLSNRSTNGFNSIAIAGFILLLINPTEIFNPGFQLSFSAVLSILIIYPIFSKLLSEYNFNIIVKNILLFFAVSLAAQLGTLPFTIIYFEKISLISLLANLLVIPTIGIIVAIAILSLLVSIISILFATFFASANMLIIKVLYYSLTNISNLSFSFLPIYNFSFFDGIIFYTFLGILIFSFKSFERKILLIPITGLTIWSIINFMSLDDTKLLPDGELSIVAIDVGQGDGFLIKFPDNTTALIDAGNATQYFDVGERIIEPLIKRLGLGKIDYAFISHLDADHYAGSIYLINNNYIDTVFKPYDPMSITDSIYQDYLTANNIPYFFYTESKKEIGGCSLYFLNDTTNSTYKNFDKNNKSGIIKLVYGKNSFLFVGDAEIEAEELLIEKYSSFLKSDVLKIGHHGSKTSTIDLFLDFVNPRIGIISAGIMNKFKHPAKSVIKKLNDRNIKIFRTDRDGAVILTSDGKQIKFINWRN